ncbi:MAG: CheR family methyltransferase, partial [Gammaproteobacteria bacterium]
RLRANAPASAPASEGEVTPTSKNPSARPLRIWSAGCATGEEAYSITMAAQAASARTSIGALRILGTDINARFLSHAVRGTYSDWSLRNLSSDERASGFIHGPGDLPWSVKPGFRAPVRFSAYNLLGVAPPPMADCDLIICRNVMIYMDHPRRERLLKRFTAALRPGGILLTGHAELFDHAHPGLRAERFPTSFIYSKETQTPASPSRVSTATTGSSFTTRSAPAPLAKRDPRTMSTRETPSGTSRPMLRSEGPAKPPARTKAGSSPSPLEVARAAAESGHYALARQQLATLRSLHPRDPGIWFLSAQVAEMLHDDDGVGLFLDRALYLDPDFLPAYLDLADLHERRGEPARAQRLLRAAWRIARNHPEARYPNIDHDELMSYLKARLDHEVSREIES